MKKFLFTSFALFALLTSPLLNGFALAGTDSSTQVSDPKTLLKGVGSGLGLGEDANEDSFVQIIGKIIKQLLAFVGVILLVIIIWAGFRWMTAGGDSGQVDEAKDMIKNATIGLAIILVSYSLSLFVFDILLEATGANTGA